MAADGEVTGHKLQLGEVGRSSLAYQLNESYEFTLCVVWNDGWITGFISISSEHAWQHRWEKTGKFLFSGWSMPDKRNRTDDAKAEADQGNYDRNSEPFKRGQNLSLWYSGTRRLRSRGKITESFFRYGSYGKRYALSCLRLLQEKLPAGSDPRFCLLKKFVNKKVQFF